MTRHAAVLAWLMACCAWLGAPVARAATAEATTARAAAVFGPGRAGDDGQWTLATARRLRLPGTSRERADLPAGTRLWAAQALKVRERGAVHDVVMWRGERPDDTGDGGFMNEVAVLAVFAAGQTAPIDVAEVKTDRMTMFGAPPVVRLTPNDDAFTLLNHHANAGQPYTESSLFQLREGRLRRIASVDLLGELSGCAQAFDEIIDWRIEPAGRALPDIVAQVTLIHAPKDATEGCTPRPAERRETLADRWRWDAGAGRYQRQPGGSLARIERWNDQRR